MAGKWRWRDVAPGRVRWVCALTERAGDLGCCGVDRSSGTQDPERYRFTGHQRDVGWLERTWDDVDVMHARTYTPFLGRFLSVDPGRDWEVSRAQSFNLYAYVRGNPVMRWDPWGLEQVPGSGGCSSPEGDEACGIVRWWSEEQLARAVAEGKIKYAEKRGEVRGPDPRAEATVVGNGKAGVVGVRMQEKSEPQTISGLAKASRGGRCSLLDRIFDTIADYTDFGFSFNLYSRGWSWSADQGGASGRGTTANTPSWVLGADVYVILGSDAVRRVDPAKVGLGSGWPGVGRFPGVEILFGKSGRIVGVSVHLGPSFFFPPGWVTGY